MWMVQQPGYTVDGQESKSLSKEISNLLSLALRGQ